MSNQRQVQLSGETIVSVSMEAQEWATVLTAINELPRKTSQPLYEKVNTALVIAAQGGDVKEQAPMEVAEEVEG